MDHSHMDHGGHMDHDMPGMGDGGHQCNMNMLFTWSTKDLCIVFHSWHVSGALSLLFSLLAIVLLTAGYEAVREMSRRYELYSKRVAEGRRDGDDLSNVGGTGADESSSLLYPGRTSGNKPTANQMKLVKAILYAVQVFYSFFIMLLFMTYNGWVMLAVAVGAFSGYMLFSEGAATKTAACH